VDMDRAMFVAVKEKPISVLFKNFRHRPIIFEFPNRVRSFCEMVPYKGESPCAMQPRPQRFA
jgi:hypothetical protein